MPRSRRRSVNRRRSGPYRRTQQAPIRDRAAITSWRFKEPNMGATEVSETRFPQTRRRRSRSRRNRRLESTQVTDMTSQTSEHPIRTSIASRLKSTNSQSSNSQKDISSTSDSHGGAKLEAVHLHRNPNYKEDDDQSAENPTLPEENLPTSIEKSSTVSSLKSKGDDNRKAINYLNSPKQQSSIIDKETLTADDKSEKSSSSLLTKSKRTEPKNEVLPPPQVVGDDNLEFDHV